MDSQDNDTRTGTDRAETLRQLREAFESLDWRNLQVTERILAPYHLTLPQAAVLSILHHEGTDLEMSQIASRTGLPPSTITSIMDRLLLRQFVERRHHPTDRRRITGSITDEGKRVVLDLQKERRALLSNLVSDFSDTELEILGNVLQRWISMADTIINRDEKQTG